MIESTGLQMWLNSDNSNEIKVVRCPRCNVPLTSTRRFKDEILVSIENITKVKVKFIGEKDSNKNKRNNLWDQLNKIYMHYNSKHLLYSSIHKTVRLILYQCTCLTSIICSPKIC